MFQLTALKMHLRCIYNVFALYKSSCHNSGDDNSRILLVCHEPMRIFSELVLLKCVLMIIHSSMITSKRLVFIWII